MTLTETDKQRIENARQYLADVAEGKLPPNRWRLNAARALLRSYFGGHDGANVEDED